MMMPETTDARYEIVKILGQGGTADVYLAKHIALNELRVLKVLHHDMMLDAKRRTKFKMEAQVAAHLKHPSIVQVFDVTQTASKLQIEMEYIDGLSLRQHLERRQSFPLSVSLAIVYAILEGLEHAHNAQLTFGNMVLDGVIHRDLKPENIMIRKNGQPVICDFGVAKVGADQLTQTQHISGSVAYMAPERLRGELSTRSIDVFALGVMAFELHKGYRPFSGQNKTQVLENILKWKMLDLDAEWRGGDQAVLQIIRKAIARDPALRYQDASQMMDALRPVYKLYHGEAAPGAVVRDYLTRGQFTTAEFNALLPDEGSWKTRLGVGIAVLAVCAGIFGVYSAWTAAQKRGTSASSVRTGSDGDPVTRSNSLSEAEAAVRKLPADQQQQGYYDLARATLQENRDPAQALLLVNKALDRSFHPTIAALKVEILMDQDLLNLADSELAKVRPWLPKLSPENRARFHWLEGQLEARKYAVSKAPVLREKAKAALREYLNQAPQKAGENQRQALQLLQSLE